MKIQLTLVLSCTMMLMGALNSHATTVANTPDSVFMRPDIENGAHSMYIAYSLDKKHWKHVDCALFDGDYGPWGSQKKIFYPVISYDGKMFHATFIPDPAYRAQKSGSFGQIAVTESADLCLWKPQDYPFIPETDFNNLLSRQQKASAENIITVPFTAIKALEDKAKRKALDAQWESENYVATAKPIADQADSITLHMTVNLNDKKAISSNLIGAFFEDISYAADGGIYAELIQNRDFEYTPADQKGWNALTSWTLQGDGSTVSVKDADGISQNNAHYAVISTTTPGARFINSGWDGIVLKKGAKYNLSLFIKGIGDVRVSLVSDGKTLASCILNSKEKQASPLVGAWGIFKAVLTSSADATNAQLVIEPLQAGELDIDFVSLFPKDTFKGRENGLRKDLAQTIADIHPRFIRFPGGCASHGNGTDNIYHWKASIGNLWDRQPDFNIWHYHQTRGLGFYEYFLFCEDIGAEPLPVLAAGVPCQNSSVGGNGQNGGIPWAKDAKSSQITMESYLQELLDLIEWANGDAKTSDLAKMRAKAGHPKPFNLKYLGIGNEDLFSDTFMERYTYLINGVRKAHPEITIVGTVGPFWEGSDYEYGWKAARENNLAIVDEHYYNTPGWYFHHRDFYDDYDRNENTGVTTDSTPKTKVYLGEWASHGTMTSNALIEAAYLTNVERNADVVCMSSYAPLLAKDKHTNWNPSLIYFDNSNINPTANYYVQRLFGQNSGDEYAYSDISVDYHSIAPAQRQDSKPLLRDIKNRIDRSVVIDSKTGDIIVKIVSLLPKNVNTTVSIPGLSLDKKASYTVTTLSQSTAPDKAKQWEVNDTHSMNIAFQNSKDTEIPLLLPAWSVTMVRIHK